MSPNASPSGASTGTNDSKGVVRVFKTVEKLEPKDSGEPEVVKITLSKRQKAKLEAEAKAKEQAEEIVLAPLAEPKLKKPRKVPTGPRKPIQRKPRKKNSEAESDEDVNFEEEAVQKPVGNRRARTRGTPKDGDQSDDFEELGSDDECKKRKKKQVAKFK